MLNRILRIFAYLALLFGMQGYAQVATAPIQNPRVRFWCTATSPCSGGFLYTYAAGGFTPKITYKDTAGTQNSNPIILDANGEAVIYFGSGSYRLVLQNSQAVQIWSQDNVSSANFTSPLTNVTIDTANGNVVKLNGNTLTATTGTATVTIPNITDTLVNLTSAQTLSNKTIGALALTITDPGHFASSGFFAPSQTNVHSVDFNASVSQFCGSCGGQFGIAGGVNGSSTTNQLGGFGVFGVGIGNAAVTGVKNQQGGGQFLGWARANGASVWGIQPNVSDDAGLTSGLSMLGAEFDINIHNPTTAYSTVNGVLTTFGAGTHAGDYGNGYLLSGNTTAGTRWVAGFISSDGAAATGLSLGSQTATANSFSQPIWLWYRDAGNNPQGVSAFQLDNTGTLLLGAKTSAANFISSVATGTQPYAATSTTVNTNLNADMVDGVHGTSIAPLYNISGTVQASAHSVKGTCTLGTNCSVTLSGSAVFSSNTSYDCWARDDTTAANAVTITRTSGSAIAFTGTGTDVINFFCTGN